MSSRKAHILSEKERTDDIRIKENVDFAGMYLSDHVLQGLHTAGFEYPSPIQLEAVPLARCGLDLVVQAKSGTGKTVVFTITALEMVSVAAATTQVLIIAPTREIAVQIAQVISAVGCKMPGLRVSTFIGGIHISQDRAKLRCCHIAVGTPGRLTQLVELGHLKLDNIRLLVLDEADQLLTGQFTDGVVQLSSGLPLNKQVLTVSATYTEEIAAVAEGLMRSPTQVRLGKDSPALLGVNQFVRLLPYHHQPHRRQQTKMAELQGLLSTVTFNQCLVFSNSQMRAESICNELRASGWPVSYLSGGLAQQDRLLALDALCSYKCRVLVSTDLSARGLDSEHVNLVINMDLPRDQATYLHRVGRSGRFGSLGGAVTLVTEGEEWLSMKAIASLANVKVYLLNEDWNANILNTEIQGLEKVEFIEDEDLSEWLEKQALQQTNRKGKEKSSGKSKDRSKKKGGKENAYFGSGKEKDINNKKLNPLKSIDSHNSTHSDSSKSKLDLLEKESVELQMEKSLKLEKLKEAAFKQRELDIEKKKKDFTVVKTLLNNLNVKPRITETSYDEIYKRCAAKYDTISASDDPKVKLPPIPNLIVPSEDEFQALKMHLKDTEEDNKGRVEDIDATYKVNETSIFKALHAMIEGNDPLTHLKANESCEGHNITSGSIQNESSNIKENNSKDFHQSTDYSSDSESNCSSTTSIKESKEVKQIENIIEDQKIHTSMNSHNSAGIGTQPIKISKKNSGKNYRSKYTIKEHKSKQKIKMQHEGEFSENYHNNYHYENEHYDTNNYGTYDPETNYTDNMYQNINYGNQHYGDWGYGSHGTFYDQSYMYYYQQQQQYISNSQKFASMMDYVKTMGRMSAQIAQDFYSQDSINLCADEESGKKRGNHKAAHKY